MVANDAYMNNGLYWTSVMPIALRLGIQRYGVVSGCVITQQTVPDMTVRMTAGAMKTPTNHVVVSANTSISINAAHASLDRYDLITLNTSGTVVYTAGTAAASPVPPEIPSTNTPLAVIYVAAGVTTILDAAIYDLRITVSHVSVPLGTVLDWDKSLTGTPALMPEFVECNGQVLSDPESPYDGRTMRNLNGYGGGTKRFIRGSTTSGTAGGSETHTHPISSPSNHTPGSGAMLGHPGVTGSTDTLPSYVEMVKIVRIK